MSLVMHEFIRSRDQVVVKKKRVLTCKHGVVFRLSSLKTPTHNSTASTCKSGVRTPELLNPNFLVGATSRCSHHVFFERLTARWNVRNTQTEWNRIATRVVVYIDSLEQCYTSVFQ